MSEEEIIKTGIAAIKSGDIPRAASLFAQVVKENPSSERGWFLLGMSCSTPDQREYCLRRVLVLNPNNSDARKQLGLLSKSVPVSSPPQFPASVTSAPKPSMPVATPVSPFVYEEAQESVPENNPEFSSDDKPPRKNVEPEKRKPKKKKSNAILLLSLLAIPTLIICGGGVGIAYVFFSGQMTQWMSPNAPVSIPAASQTSTPLVIVAPTFTLAPPTVIPSLVPTVVYTPLFENAPCFFDVPEDANVKCGYVIVPEDRTGDPSHTIKLAVAVFHSTSGSPASAPVMFLQGGPGAEAVQLSADAYDYLVVPFLSERDFIVFDQRGTGSSEPALKCEELSKIYSQDIHGLIPSTTRELVYSNAFLSCNGLMRAQGVELNTYTTVASAADLKDVLNVLGYPKVLVHEDLTKEA